MTRKPLPPATLSPASASRAQSPGPNLGTFGFDTAGMDRSAAPGDDFVRFASGTYQRELVIPPDQASYGMFDKLVDLSKEQVREIVEAAANQEGDSSPESRKVGDYFASFMDEAGIEAKGLEPLRPLLDAVAAITTRTQLAEAFGRGNRLGGLTPLGLDIGQNLVDPNIMSVYVGQGGIGLPERDYYFDKEARFVEIRQAYLAHIAAMLQLLGMDSASQRAEGIMALETKIARTHWNKVKSREIEKLHNPIHPKDLAETYPGLDWKAFLAAAGIKVRKELIVAQPSAVKGTAKLVGSVPLETWKDYLAFHTLKAAAAYLPKAVVEENFAFEGKVLSGRPEMLPRWRRGVNATTGALGEAVGKLYVAKHLPPDAKAQADVLVKNLIAAMDSRIAGVSWLEAKTKKAARAKLAVFVAKIGHPDKWKDYSQLEVRRGDPLGNALRAAEFDTQRSIDKLGKPIDRTEWHMAPMTVNAYANPFWNEIVFPAAIFQAPFFDPKADPAINYGGIGAVIGHEISHHFDDQGRKFDRKGGLSDWWTPEDAKRFKAMTKKVIAQCGAYEPMPGIKLNGELTLGENLADLAGIAVAYEAYQNSLGGKPAEVLDGFTGDQRFFLGWAQVWRGGSRDEALRNQIANGPHSPAFLRPLAVRNMDAWYKAFDVKPGQALYLAPEDRIRAW